MTRVFSLTRSPLSDDLLVPEKVLQICDLQVRRCEHHNDAYYSVDDDAILNLLVLVLELVLSDSESVHFAPDQLQRVFDLLRLQLDARQVLLRHDVRVVRRLHARGQRELVLLVLLCIHILDAQLVVPAVERGKVVAHFRLVPQSLDFFAPRVSDCQDQVRTRGVDFDDS